jgi:hypothetical protein
VSVRSALNNRLVACVFRGDGSSFVAYALSLFRFDDSGNRTIGGRHQIAFGMLRPGRRVGARQTLYGAVSGSASSEQNGPCTVYRSARRRSRWIGTGLKEIGSK